MKRKQIMSLVIIAAMMGSADAAAYNVDYNPENKSAVISGTAKAGSDVAIEILKPGKTESDLEELTPENYSEVIWHADQTEAGNDGKFSFAFGIDGDYSSSEYITRVTVGDGEAEKNLLIYINAADFEKAFAAINSAATAAEMAKAIEDGKNYLGLDREYYPLLTDSQKLALADEVLKNRGAKYENLESFRAAFRNALAAQAVNRVSGGGMDISKTLADFEDILKLGELESNATYEKQADEVKKLILAAMSKGGFGTVEDVRTAMTENTILTAVLKIEGYDGVYDILSGNNEYLKIDFSAYNALSDKAAVLRKIAGKTYSSCESLKEDFNKLVAEGKKSNGGNGGGGSGSGGGSSSGRSKNNTVSLPVADTGSTITPTKTERFNDLANAAWAKEAIEALTEKGIISGKGDGSFCPGDNVKREEFIKMLVCGLGLYNPDAETDFTDAQKGSWSYSYIASAQVNNLTSGRGDGSFGVGENLTRQDLAVLFKRAAEREGVTFGSGEVESFTDDAEISEYARDAVYKMKHAGLISGMEDGSFQPKRTATRAEAAKILYGFLQLLNK